MKDLPNEVRPREKLLSRGSSALSDTELLAILLRTGLAGKNVLQLASELLDAFGGVAGLLHAELKDLSKVKGLGPAKRAELLAVLELSKRCLAQKLDTRTFFNDPKEAQNYLRLALGHKPVEVFGVLFLNGQHELIVFEEVFHGTLAQTSVYPREVVEKCLKHRASAVILAHNHPSGSLEASAADIHITQQLKAALQLVDVRVLDHIIVTHSASLSMADKGLV